MVTLSIESIFGSLARNVRARPLLRLLELGALTSSGALARAAVCLNASRILAGRDRGDERQNHNDDPGIASHHHRPPLAPKAKIVALTATLIPIRPRPRASDRLPLLVSSTIAVVIVRL